jgi:DNA repair protein RecO (recombination protein O)
MASAGRSSPPFAAYVLHSYDWSESSLIVELFTRALGRVVAAAKGAKRPTSNFRPVLLPFHPLAVWLSRSGGGDDESEIKNLRAAEWAGGTPLAGERLISGFYLNELLLKGLARQDPHPALFDAYAEALAELGAGRRADDEAATLRAFELRLLRELGLLPDLALVTASAEPLTPARRYGLVPEAGVVADHDGALGASWIALQAALMHGSHAALQQACAAEPAALRMSLRNLVHYHLATPQLKTRRLSLQMQRLVSPTPSEPSSTSTRR